MIQIYCTTLCLLIFVSVLFGHEFRLIEMEGHNGCNPSESSPPRSEFDLFWEQVISPFELSQTYDSISQHFSTVCDNIARVCFLVSYLSCFLPGAQVGPPALMCSKLRHKTLLSALICFRWCQLCLVLPCFR